MANKFLYLFYSEEEFPLTRSTSRTRKRYPNDPISTELLYFPAVWLLKGGEFYRLDFKTVEDARQGLQNDVLGLKLKKHTTKHVKHDDFVEIITGAKSYKK